MSTKMSVKPAKATKQGGRYLYAVIEAGETAEFGPIGIDGGQRLCPRQRPDRRRRQ